jgi:protease-4
MKHGLLLLPLALGVISGCSHPLQLVTDSRIAIDKPVPVRVTAELPPTNNTGPVIEMDVEGEANCVAGPKIAVVDVDGLLLNVNMTGPYSAGENPVDLFRERLDAAARDPDVCGLVVRINSPGGGVAATGMMWRELRDWRARSHRPVVACLMDLATGGAYYLATASDRIIAHPGTVTGGVGVVLNLFNLEDFMGGLNIVAQPIKSGKNIDTGTVLRPLTPEAQRLLQGMADEFHDHFKEVVRRQRPHLDASGDETLDGRVFTASQALRRGLIDQVGYLDDAIAAARQAAGRDEARVVLLHRCNDPARTPYAITPNVPAQAALFPFSLPGAERSRLPTFLYAWQPDPTLERLGGK